jgi:hypothetical protein
MTRCENPQPLCVKNSLGLEWSLYSFPLRGRRGRGPVGWPETRQQGTALSSYRPLAVNSMHGWQQSPQMPMSGAGSMAHSSGAVWVAEYPSTPLPAEQCRVKPRVSRGSYTRLSLLLRRCSSTHLTQRERSISEWAPFVAGGGGAAANRERPAAEPRGVHQHHGRAERRVHRPQAGGRLHLHHGAVQGLHHCRAGLHARQPGLHGRVRRQGTLPAPCGTLTLMWNGCCRDPAPAATSFAPRHWRFWSLESGQLRVCRIHRSPPQARGCGT